MTHDTTPPIADGPLPRRPFVLIGLAVVLVCVMVGITLAILRAAGQRHAAAGPGRSDAGNPPQTLRYPVEELSALADYLSDLDDGRLRAAPPIDWYPASRGKDYVARFVFDRSRQSPLPRITIEARAADFSPWRDVDEANLWEFLERFRSTLDEDLQRAMQRSQLALVLGDVPCIAYQTPWQIRVGNRVVSVDREVLVTLRRGRLYAVTLDVFTGKLDDYRADAWAVVAGLQFLEPSAPEETPPEPADSPPPQDSPSAAPAEPASQEPASQEPVPAAPAPTDTR